MMNESVLIFVIVWASSIAYLVLKMRRDWRNKELDNGKD